MALSEQESEKNGVCVATRMRSKSVTFIHIQEQLRNRCKRYGEIIQAMINSMISQQK